MILTTPESQSQKQTKVSVLKITKPKKQQRMRLK
jgi:hypothetical protein